MMVRARILLITLLVSSNIPAHALCVKKVDVNIRNGPGKKYTKVGEVFKFTPFKKVQIKGTWVRVKNVDGKTYWIHRNLVTDKFKCASVKAEDVHIRSGPGTQYKEIDHSPAIKYETFKVLERKGSWVKVQDEFGGKGWIYRKYLWIQ